MEASLEHANERYAVLDAYAQLAQEQPFSDIKVSDICAARGISKSSFYRLFGGASDVLIWYQNFTSDIGMHQIGVSYDFKHGHLTSILLLEQYHDIYKEYASSVYWNTDFSLQCINNHVEAMRRMLKLHGVKMTTELLYKLRSVAVTAHELVGFFMGDDALQGEERPSAERLVDIMYSFVPDDLKVYFDNPIETPETPSFVNLIVQSMLLKSQYAK